MSSTRWLTAEIEENAGRLRRAAGEGDVDARVLAAMARVPRHAFVPPDLADVAYEDVALPIGHGQTISQPSLVAFMIDVLRVRASDVVLDVGSGSGYQAAVLAELVWRVHAVELVEPLAVEAARRLRRLGYTNIDVRCGDGHGGLREHAPFDAICVAASASELPPPLIDQLAPGGRMVIAVGDELRLVTKDVAGGVRQRPLCWVAFVPLLASAPRGQNAGG